MEKMLHLLETFTARGSDGRNHVVHGYEYLTRLDEVPTSAPGQWEPTGLAEYKLADGRHVSVDKNGAMGLPEIGLRLERLQGEESKPAASRGSVEALVACDVCLREVPRSEAVVPEAADYVAYFCGLQCFEKWKSLPESPAAAGERARP
jgi:hypothetical protein